MNKSEWKLLAFNDTDRVTGQGGDCPVQPGDQSSGIICDTEEEARSFMRCWKTGWSRDEIRVELYHDGELIETHFMRGKYDNPSKN